jgi:methylglyoxal reductase
VSGGPLIGPGPRPPGGPRQLGRTGRTVEPIAFGTSGVGGDRFRGVEPRDAQRALCHALEHGVDLVDTALRYGRGQSEQLVGEAVRELRARDRVVVATKVPPADDVFPAAANRLGAAFAPAYLQAQVEQSLRNLKLEVIPLCQLHVWRDAWLDDGGWPELRATMVRLVSEGKVLHWGVSANHGSVDDCVRVMADPLVTTAQLVWNLFDRRAEPALAAAAQHGVAVLARCVLDEGALGGQLGAGARFPIDDFRTAYFAPPRLDELALRLAALCEFVTETPPAATSTPEATDLAARAARARHEPEVRAVDELAIRFALSPPAVVAAVIGMRTRASVDRNLRLRGAAPLSSTLLSQLASHAWDKDWTR